MQLRGLPDWLDWLLRGLQDWLLPLQYLRRSIPWCVLYDSLDKWQYWRDNGVKRWQTQVHGAGGVNGAGSAGNAGNAGNLISCDCLNTMDWIAIICLPVSSGGFYFDPLIKTHTYFG